MAESPDILRPSRRDDIMLCQAVCQRFNELKQSYQRIKGEPLGVPQDIQRELDIWQHMAVRHRSGDYRHKDSELLCLQKFAQWTVSVNCNLRGQPIPIIEWR